MVSSGKSFWFFDHFSERSYACPICTENFQKKDILYSMHDVSALEAHFNLCHFYHLGCLPNIKTNRCPSCTVPGHLPKDFCHLKVASPLISSFYMNLPDALICNWQLIALFAAYLPLLQTVNEEGCLSFSNFYEALCMFKRVNASFITALYVSLLRRCVENSVLRPKISVLLLGLWQEAALVAFADEILALIKRFKKSDRLIIIDALPTAESLLKSDAIKPHIKLPFACFAAKLNLACGKSEIAISWIGEALKMFQEITILDKMAEKDAFEVVRVAMLNFSASMSLFGLHSLNWRIFSQFQIFDLALALALKSVAFKEPFMMLVARITDNTKQLQLIGRASQSIFSAAEVLDLYYGWPEGVHSKDACILLNELAAHESFADVFFEIFERHKFKASQICEMIFVAMENENSTIADILIREKKLIKDPDAVEKVAFKAFLLGNVPKFERLYAFIPSGARLYKKCMRDLHLFCAASASLKKLVVARLPKHGITSTLVKYFNFLLQKIKDECAKECYFAYESEVMLFSEIKPDACESMKAVMLKEFKQK